MTHKVVSSEIAYLQNGIWNGIGQGHKLARIVGLDILGCLPIECSIYAIDGQPTEKEAD